MQALSPDHWTDDVTDRIARTAGFTAPLNIAVTGGRQSEQSFAAAFCLSYCF